MLNRPKKRGECPLCKRHVFLTFHHLIPRKMHRRSFFRKHYDKQALNQGIYICRLCHSGIHRIYDEMQLAKRFSSLEAITADDALSKHFQWVSKQRININ